MNKPIHVHVVPAAPGFRLVHRGDEDMPLFLGETVIAWRIETYEAKDGTLFSTSYALTGSGEINSWGILEPTGAVAAADDSLHDTFDEASKAVLAEMKALQAT
jgi:hypothetical protein